MHNLTTKDNHHYHSGPFLPSLLSVHHYFEEHVIYTKYVNLYRTDVY